MSSKDTYAGSRRTTQPATTHPVLIEFVDHRGEVVELQITYQAAALLSDDLRKLINTRPPEGS